MDTTFIYKGKTVTTPNLEKKLKRMRITLSDIEIVDEVHPKKESENSSCDGTNLYYFINLKTKESIISIYPTLDNLSFIENINDYVLQI